jgi:hypothetical protein
VACKLEAACNTAYQQLDRSSQNFFVIDVSAVPGGREALCVSGGVDLCGVIPRAMGPSGSGANASPPGVTAYLGRPVDGGTVLFDSRNVPGGYRNNGEVVWHELTHHKGRVDGNGGPYGHSASAFCGVPTYNPAGVPTRIAC